MAIQPFIRLGVSLPGLTGPVLDASKVTPIFPVPLEDDAADQWVFNTGDSSCLTGLVNQTVLSPNGTAPTFSGDFLTIADYIWSGSGAVTPGGLRTGVTDSANFTIMVAFRAKATVDAHTSTVITGSMSETAGVGGSAVYKTFVNSSSPNNNVPNARTRPGSNHLLGSTPLDPSAWYIACISGDGAGNYTYYIPNLADPLTEAVSKTVSANKLSFGNAYWHFTDGISAGIDLREGVVWNGIGKSVAEMDAVAARIRLRAQVDGITIV